MLKKTSRRTGNLSLLLSLRKQKEAALRLKVITLRLEAVGIRLEAIAIIRNKEKEGTQVL